MGKVDLETWKPDHPEGTEYALDINHNQIVARLPNGDLLYYDLSDDASATH